MKTNISKIIQDYLDKKNKNKFVSLMVYAGIFSFMALALLLKSVGNLSLIHKDKLK